MIEVKDLTKKFDARGIAGLHGVSFSMAKGEVLGILGPNGSGKSTLLNLISQKFQPDGGSVTVDGEISFFPSLHELKNLNVQKFLIQSIKLDIDDEKKLQLTRDIADTFEFTFQLRQNLEELSSGQKQKVMLAKEIINRPTLLLMDEPFAHLDPFSRIDILKSLFKYIKQQDISVLWVTHDLNEAFKFSDRIALLNFGKLEQIGKPHDLVKTPRNLFVAQFLGYKNFSTIRFEKNHWVTPWGNLSFPEKDQAEAILVIPDVAWKIDLEGTNFKILERHANVQAIDYELSWNDLHFTWRRPPQHTLLEAGTQVRLSPILTDCFLIPL